MWIWCEIPRQKSQIAGVLKTRILILYLISVYTDHCLYPLLMLFDCKRCGKSFARKAGLTQHEKRKTPCVKETANEDARDDTPEDTPAAAQRIEENKEENREEKREDNGGNNVEEPEDEKEQIIRELYQRVKKLELHTEVMAHEMWVAKKVVRNKYSVITPDEQEKVDQLEVLVDKALKFAEYRYNLNMYVISCLRHGDADMEMADQLKVELIKELSAPSPWKQ